MTVHTFSKSLTIGKLCEQILDEIFSKWYKIKDVTLEEEKAFGIDRRFYPHTDPTKEITVEYKADSWTDRTGNVFIEYEVSGKPGWSWKTKADQILYAVFNQNKIKRIHVISNQYLVDNREIWKETYPHREIKNVGYSGHGILVPESALECKILRFK